MAFISYVPEEEASPQLMELYDRYRAGWGGVDNIIRIHSHNPPSMAGHMQLYRSVMFGRSPLSRAQREMIAVTVSGLNKCFY
jgi:alkylhydroperoxidase family enzyme